MTLWCSSNASCHSLGKKATKATKEDKKKGNGVVGFGCVLYCSNLRSENLWWTVFAAMIQ